MSVIAVFDSGIGGLTVVKEIYSQFPKASIVYLGDTARVPYGDKSPEKIIEYAKENSRFLEQFSFDALVIACNSASAYASQVLQNQFSCPVIDVITTGAMAVDRIDRKKRVVVLGTRATIQSKAYQKKLTEIDPNLIVKGVACPLFVPLVEEGFINHKATDLIIEEMLRPIHLEKSDLLLLGCTHYPLLKKRIQKVVGEDITIIDSASSCANYLKSFYQSNHFSFHCFVTDYTKQFHMMAEKILGFTFPLEEVNFFSSSVL